MPVTIKDIAKAAGVSHGTVSNVLSKKGNVSAEKIELVKNAAMQLGYHVNENAKNLKQGDNNRIAFIIPNMNEKKYQDLYSAADETLTDQGYGVDLHITMGSPLKEKNFIKEALSSRVSAILAISCIGGDDDFYFNENISDTPIILLEREIKVKGDNICIMKLNVAKIVGDMVDYLRSRKMRSAALFTAKPYFSYEQELVSELSKKFKQYQITLRHYSARHDFNEIQAIYNTKELEDCDCIIAMGMEKTAAVKTAHSLVGTAPLPPIISIGSREPIYSGNLIYEVDYKDIGVKAAFAVIDRLRKKTGLLNHVFEPAGFRQVKFHAAMSDRQLKLLTLDSPASDALAAIAPYIKKMTGIDLTVIKLSYPNLYHVIRTMDADSDYDILRLDTVWISDIADKILMPLENTCHDWTEITSKFLPELYYTYTHYNNLLYTLPFDPSCQILLYRDDLFNDIKIGRLYYEKFKKPLTVPKTFEEYNHVASFFTRSINPDSPVPYGTAVLYGPTSIPACEFLSRFYSFGGDFAKSGRDIFSPIAQTALDNYIEAYGYTDGITGIEEDVSNITSYAKGDAAMAINFSNHASKLMTSRYSIIAEHTKYEIAPGNCPLVGGGVFGIPKNTKKIDSIFKLMKFIFDDEINSLLALLSGSSSCKKTFENYDVMKLYPWLNTAKNSFALGKRRYTTKNSLLGHSEFYLESVIGISIYDAVLGIKSSQETLKLIRKKFAKNS